MWSIVVPTYDRETALTACLDALAATALPAGAAEVIVVDDGSPRPVADVVAAFAPRLPLRTCRQRNAGPAAARNAGARDARGDRLVFLDDDCLVDRTWWTRLVAHCRRHPAANGNVSSNPPSSTKPAVGTARLFDVQNVAACGRPFERRDRES